MRQQGIVRAYAQAFNAGDWTGLRPLFSDKAMIRGVLGWGSFDDVLPVWRELHDGLSLTLAIDAMVEEGAVVVARFTERGRFVGPFRGLAGREPSGKSYEVVAMEWFEFEDGRIARRWGARDFSAIIRMVT